MGALMVFLSMVLFALELFCMTELFGASSVWLVVLLDLLLAVIGGSSCTIHYQLLKFMVLQIRHRIKQSLVFYSYLIL